MAFYNRNGEKKRISHDFRRHEEEVVRSLCRLGSRPISPRSMQEEEKRIRREIANSNERRRMQSINAGFQYLRKLLPHREGEKLSKASILQQTADFIYQLEQEKTCLLEQNSQLKRRVIDNSNNTDSDGCLSDSPLPKRVKRESAESSDEGIGSSPSSNESSTENMKRELIELKLSLEHERCIRARLEEQIKNLELRLGIAENDYDVALQDHVSYHSSSENIGKQKIVNIVVDNHTIGSPLHVSSSKVDNFHEVPPSPELPPEEIPEDLSGKNSSPPHHSYCYVAETPPSNVATVPVLHLTSLTSPPTYTMELEVTSQKPYRLGRCRPNLETIVEAIRHVEGDHMFRDDSLSPVSPISSPNHWNDPQSSSQEIYEQSYNETLSLQHQIIRNAPVSQLRPGVIVSKLS